MDKLVTKNGYWMERTDALEWEIGKEKKSISVVQGLEAWKVWSLLCHQQNVKIRWEKGREAFATFQEHFLYQQTVPSCSEAIRIDGANCHGTRQYLEHDDEDRIGFKGDPIFSADDASVGHRIARSYDEALQTFHAPFSFGWAHHDDCKSGLPALYHSGRVLSKEGVCFEKTNAGLDGAFFLKGIEDLQSVYGSLVYGQTFPRREVPWQPEGQLKLSPFKIYQNQLSVAQGLRGRNEREYLKKIRAKIRDTTFVDRLNDE
jgi:hypothetical protein